MGRPLLLGRIRAPGRLAVKGPSRPPRTAAGGRSLISSLPFGVERNLAQ